MKIETPQQAAQVFGLDYPDGADRPTGHVFIGIAQSFVNLAERIMQLEEKVERIMTDLYPDTQRQREIGQLNGQALGYLQCCIDDFCSRDSYETASPEQKKAAKHGFIPCHAHAIKILAGECTIESLIADRDPDLPPFGDQC